MHTKLVVEPCPVARFFVLPSADTSTEPRVALVMPGRLPVVFPTLTDATTAMRAEVAR